MYDSYWLRSYQEALSYLEGHNPSRATEFRQAMEPFKTRLDFKVVELPQLLSAEELRACRGVIDALKPLEIEAHEALGFGRFVVHDHEYFNRMQREFVPRVSELVGEAVEPSYNFLSLYSRSGVCPLHLDAPNAKWTLDICLNQSVEWPIYISSALDWPTGMDFFEGDWATKIRNQIPFKPYTLFPGDAVIFSGSSQWHYRDRLPARGCDDFCHLVFFHYVPRGTSAIKEPEQWPGHFASPNLPYISGYKPSS